MTIQSEAARTVNDRKLADRLGYGVLDLETGSGAGFEDVHRYSYLVDPELNPKATARRLSALLGRSFTEKEARATSDEIVEYMRRRQGETGEALSVEQAAAEWDKQYGLAFRRRWYLTRPEPDQHQYMPGARERTPGPVSKAAVFALPELKPLLEAGFSVTDILFEVAKEPLTAVKFALRAVPRKERNREYVRLVADLTGWTLSEEEAERVWAQVLKHKLYLSEKAGEDVPIERACVDYFKRMRLSGLGRAALWETGQLFAPNSTQYLDDPRYAPVKPGVLFPA